MNVIFSKVCSVLMVILICSLPFVSLAQNATEAEEIAAAEAAAERDAVADTQGTTRVIWFLSGFLFGPASRSGVPTPNPVRFAGKSAIYITTYTEVYEKKVVSRQNSMKALGCITGALVGGCVGILMIAQSQ